ncbi:hypothetical protein KFL_008810010 [Klebsormidium nitens]|uniref:Uncharacterized protein n=1 Tax=Klebsormidium nitens TaxID=105231 RepID=A0A1Y1IP89_KLENI|nr:hypothetical protein KFL_008810010 [Klebsormidium nitens]|eukprot:GAQ91912.1 hypothetical protein KFL_008810010 [Klebsormidium nitens]
MMEASKAGVSEVGGGRGALEAGTVTGIVVAARQKENVEMKLSARQKKEFHELVRELFRVTDNVTGAVFSKSQQPQSIQDSILRGLKGLARKWSYPLPDLSTRATEYANRLHNDHGIVNAEGVAQAPDAKQLLRATVTGTEMGTLVDSTDVVLKPLPKRPGFFRRELQPDSERWRAKVLNLIARIQSVASVEEVEHFLFKINLSFLEYSSDFSRQEQGAEESLVVTMAKDYRSIVKIQFPDPALSDIQESFLGIVGTLNFQEIVTRFMLEDVALSYRHAFVSHALAYVPTELVGEGYSEKAMRAAREFPSARHYVVLLSNQRWKLCFDFPPRWPLSVGQLRAVLIDASSQQRVHNSLFEKLHEAFFKDSVTTSQTLGKFHLGCENLVRAHGVGSVSSMAQTDHDISGAELMPLEGIAEDPLRATSLRPGPASGGMPTTPSNTSVRDTKLSTGAGTGIGGSLEVTRADLDCLRNQLELNNAVVDFFGRYFEDQLTRGRNKPLVMNIFFLQRVSKSFRAGRRPSSRELRTLLAFPGASDLLQRPVTLIPVVVT